MSQAKKGKAPWNKGVKGKQKAWNKGKKNIKSSIKIVRICLKTEKKIKHYNSSMDDTREGFNSGHIIQCCKGKLKQHKGYRWVYLEEYNG